MLDTTPRLVDTAWPLTLLLAWLAAEYGYQHWRLPRISAYALAGFALAPAQAGLLPQNQPASMMLLANMAFCLILFECGYRINLRWLRSNPWIAASSLLEAGLSFGALCWLLLWWGQPVATALPLAALGMASSPATVVRVVSECRSSGQVSERLLHLAVLNTVLAVLAFRISLDWALLHRSGNVLAAAYSSLVVLAISMVLGLFAAVLTPLLLRLLRRGGQDSTLAFALAVICLVALTFNLQLSPVVATLTFGLWARHSRLAFNASQRGFGSLGDLFSLLLFVFIASRLDWQPVQAGLLMGLAYVGVRLAAKLLGIGLLAHASGITLRKGLFIGLGTVPSASLVLLLLEQTRLPAAMPSDPLLPLAAASLLLEVCGPLLLQRALVWAHEVPGVRKV